jgi:hypothetical protein
MLTYLMCVAGVVNDRQQDFEPLSQVRLQKVEEGAQQLQPAAFASP